MEITEKEYFEYKLRIACSVLPALITQYSHDVDNETHRQTLSWQASSIADSLLKEMGLE